MKASNAKSVSTSFSEQNQVVSIVAKCEFLNPGGSVKDRIGRRMVLDAEKTGRIKKGDILIEPTSGNTGIGMAMCAAARGYRMIITMPEKMSAEKENTLRGLGAEIVRTPTELPTEHIDSHMGIAYKLTQDLENAHMLDQYSNTSNPMAHYEGTAQEIWDQCDGKVDTVVLGVGTGGTVTGIARFFKDKDPNIRIVGVDPHGSILGEPAELNEKECSYLVEGVGYDFIPRVLDRTPIDKWYKNADQESFDYARRLIQQEGLLVGGSSGGVLWAAIEEAKTMKEGQRMVVVLHDSIRNYMTKYLSDDWMYLNGFKDEKTVLDSYTPKLIPNRAWGQEMTVGDLKLEKSPTVSHTATIGEAIKEMGSKQQLIVTGDDGKINSIFTSDVAMDKIFKGKITTSDNVTKSTSKLYRKTSTDIPLSELARIFTLTNYVVVNEETILTHNDLLNFFAEKA
jgi:cystathionine beta-synthase